MLADSVVMVVVKRKEEEEGQRRNLYHKSGRSENFTLVARPHDATHHQCHVSTLFCRFEAACGHTWLLLAVSLDGALPKVDYKAGRTSRSLRTDNGELATA